MKYLKYIWHLLLLTFFIAQPVSAHEVYVLSANEIEEALKEPAINYASVFGNHAGELLLWAFIGILSVGIVYYISSNKILRRLLGPALQRMKNWAPVIAQITLGLSLIASAHYGAIFGTELPTQQIFGFETNFMDVALYIAGFFLLCGLFPRIAAGLVFFLFIPLFYRFGFYMFNYLTYLGEAMTVFIFGSSFDLLRRGTGHPWWHMNKALASHLHKYKFIIMRIFFGTSLIYASVYAKYIHGALALETVVKYRLTDYFHFDPLFLVYGAFCTEIVIGLFFLLGFEIRFTSIFFLVFLTLSLVFFKEAVWPHFMLIGTALAMFCHGYDELTLGQKIMPKDKFEPIL